MTARETSEIRPLFLFSLPRSGSTLAQRILAAHSRIASGSEPWVLLPYVHALKSDGVQAYYDHGLACSAIRHFSTSLRGGLDRYKSEIRTHVLRLYEAASGEDAAYFLDKTPRYSVIASEIMDLFPEGKFVFLWRHPLAVAASMVELFGGGDAHLLRYPTTGVDLYRGLASLVDAFGRSGDRAIGVRYEDLVADPEATWGKIFEYLELRFEPAVLEGFSQVKYRMGDPRGTESYREISQAPLRKWMATMANPFRKAWCRRYVRWIGDERLAIMGYDPRTILSDVDTIPFTTRRLARDVARTAYGWARAQARTRLFPSDLARQEVFRATPTVDWSDEA